MSRIKQMVFAAPLVLSVLGASLTLGCATEFTGQPHFQGGPRECYRKCSSVGLVMQSFVYVGEYSSACVCGMPNESAEATPASATGATAAAAAGVAMQMRRQQERRQQH